MWPALVEAAARRELPIYEQLSPLVQTNPLSMRWALDPIQNYCLEANLPPLSSIVVGKRTGIPGAGFVGWRLDDIDTAHQMVFNHDWSDVQNPYIAFGPSDTPESLGQMLYEHPEKRDEIYAKVKVRGVAQRVFKEALLLAYEQRCAICKLSFYQALDGAHIVPWAQATDGQRLDPRNGLLLCTLHHRLFDRGLITIDSLDRVQYCDPMMEDGPYSISDAQMTAELHGTPAHLPSDPALRPSAAAMMLHRQSHSWDAE
ncbi:HNH endonuclease signature motif containing protein [Pseudomonas syringae pv. actinidiae]|uniref:HNH endonuclease n=1 Tax=Pseudomonas TaxID=286 RepID=UPI00037DD13D|nr:MULTISPECIES: HNH endonuclease signature motif containing protein [Pseudomonas]AKT30789.1 hypothetical protein IYO_014935 [Pseudomonas syringae pv. actinidiae ICMP 18884]AOE57205.1 hypothetical protein NZ708_14920 [Pseudomonas syringae pv. actinidiae ICMP 18708]KGS14473.1 hypothetical protein OA77_10930 [Pseudomonas coronafaciens]MCQ4653442.1 HNH endonuclease [Pseudomonas syringae]APP98162.1 hypothetical protein PsaNZ45_15470 [Pseudomonas syringae pv. actinidiae]